MMMGGGGDGDLIGGRMLPAASFQLQMLPATGEIAGASGGGQRGKEEKIPLWGKQETRDLIEIRADLERDFKLSRRNKTVWEVVAMRMREKGYRRTSDQCKCKWKNMVNRYKGKETTDAESGRQCPFFEELHAIFSERARNTHRLLLESESGIPISKKKSRKLGGGRSSDELSDDEDEDEDDSEEEKPARGKKKKAAPQQQLKSKTIGSIHDLLHEFLQQQQQLEAHWWDAMDRRAQERQRFDQEWRNSMEKLERERLMLEQVWREREEQRRMREENRAEKRDALLTTLLNKLIQDDP